MIESEEKRKAVREDIERWTKFTKIKQYLRQSDIPSLVSQIIDEFYHTTLSCGHRVSSTDEGTPLEFEDFITDRSDMEHGGGMCTTQGIYCADCVPGYIKDLKARVIGKETKAHDQTIKEIFDYLEKSGEIYPDGSAEFLIESYQAFKQKYLKGGNK